MTIILGCGAATVLYEPRLLTGQIQYADVDDLPCFSTMIPNRT